MIYTDFLNSDDLKALAQSMNNRAKTLQKSGRLTPSTLRDCIYASGGKCQWCHDVIVKQPFEVDHIIPLKRGGGNITDNIAVSCPSCNRTKSDKHPAKFAQETYARTGILTALIGRVFAYYDVEPTVQKSLFDTDANHLSTNTLQSDDSPSDDPPPYIWGSSSS